MGLSWIRQWIATREDERAAVPLVDFQKAFRKDEVGVCDSSKTRTGMEDASCEKRRRMGAEPHATATRQVVTGL
jgi:hypothetical protein